MKLRKDWSFVVRVDCLLYVFVSIFCGVDADHVSKPQYNIDDIQLDSDLASGTHVKEVESGMVEVFVDEYQKWFPICSDSWEHTAESKVLCEQLGHKTPRKTSAGTDRSSKQSNLSLDFDFHCSGSEANLSQCPYRFLGENNSCYPVTVSCTSSTTLCHSGDIRLSRRNYGLVEVCVDGIWAPICKHKLVNDLLVAKAIICKQLFGNDSYAVPMNIQCPGKELKESPILTNLGCSEESISLVQDCSFDVSAPNKAECSHLLSIVCSEHANNCTEGEIRLVNGSTPQEGRVELCVQGLWVSVSDHTTYSRHPTTWTADQARVVCKQLQLPWECAIPTLVSRGGEIPVIDSIFDCNGGENHLLNCSHSPLAVTCSNYHAVGVRCQGNTSKPVECVHGDVRLVNGSRPTEGRVELCAYGYWSAVCNALVMWNTFATKLVCKKLGFPTDVLEYSRLGTPFGASPAHHPVVSVSCGGGTNDLADCLIATQSKYCSSADSVGVSCREREKYEITVDTIPFKKSYNIGSEILLKCRVPPSLQNATLPLTYEWTTTVKLNTGYFTSSHSKATLRIPLHHPSSAYYYCLVYGSGPSNLLLGSGRTNIRVQGLLQKHTATKRNVHTRQQQRRASLRVAFLKSIASGVLSELTWYHNGSVITPALDKRITLGNDNKTLIITNFSYVDSGIYKVQFNRLNIKPYNQNCNDKLIRTLRNSPVLSPVVYCVNVEHCDDNSDLMDQQSVSVKQIRNLYQSPNRVTLQTKGTVLSYEQFEHSTLQWYRNGKYVWPTSTLQKHYPSLSLQFQRNDTIYDDYGRYEVLLTIDLSTFLEDSTCQSYYSQLVPQYLPWEIEVSKGFADISYYHVYDVRDNLCLSEFFDDNVVFPIIIIILLFLIIFLVSLKQKSHQSRRNEKARKDTHEETTKKCSPKEALHD